jgi:hypothetical protein
MNGSVETRVMIGPSNWRFVRVAAAATLLMISSQLVNAASTTCPIVPAATDRVFSLDPNPPTTCLDWGSGNINGNNDAINQLGYITLDKTDGQGFPAQGALSIIKDPGEDGKGSFTINSSLLIGYTDIVLGLKGGNNEDISWAAFLLNGATSGTWEISSQGYSHGLLYGKVDPGGGDPNPVPLPAAAWLFGSALVGFIMMSNRRAV